MEKQSNESMKLDSLLLCYKILGTLIGRTVETSIVQQKMKQAHNTLDDFRFRQSLSNCETCMQDKMIGP
jgi:hypothetical protein